MTGTTPRARARARTMDDIVRIGREHLAVHGAAALSLRAVARDLGVVSSAVYRYVSSRDELLTLLVVDGFTELADTVDAALATAPADPRARCLVVGRTVRAWALAEPARYGLLYGTPVPGYHAPAQQTVQPGTRVIGALLQIIDSACRAETLVTSLPAPRMSAGLAADFAVIRDSFGLTIPDSLLLRAVSLWTGMFGAISFDVFDQYGAGTFSDRAELFDHQLDALCDLLGLPATPVG